MTCGFFRGDYLINLKSPNLSLFLIVLPAFSIFLAIKKNYFFYSQEPVELRIDFIEKNLYLSNYPRLSNGVSIDEIVSLIHQDDGKKLKIYFQYFFITLDLTETSDRFSITEQLQLLSKQDICKNQRLISIFNNRKPRLTYTLLTIITLVFSIQILHDSSFSELSLIHLGGNNFDHVRGGEFYRLITSNFLHGGFLHFINNVAAIFVLGSCLEKVVGIKTFIKLTVLSAVLGATTSVIFRDIDITTSVGSSTIVMGYVSALIYINIISPNWFGRHFTYDYFTLIIFMLLPTLYPYILNMESTVDHLAHVGGGAALVFLYPTLKRNSIFSIEGIAD